jgi:hypothetical protein
MNTVYRQTQHFNVPHVSVQLRTIRLYGANGIIVRYATTVDKHGKLSISNVDRYLRSVNWSSEPVSDNFHLTQK